MTTSTEPTTELRSTELTPGARFRRIGGGLSLLAAGTLVFASLLMIPYAEPDEGGVPADRRRSPDAHPVGRRRPALRLPAAAACGIDPRAAGPPGRAEDVARRDGARRPRRGPVRHRRPSTTTTWRSPTACRRDEALRIYDLAASYGQGALVALPSMLGLVVGINLALFAAWRARAIPVMPLVLSVVGWAVFTAFSGDAWLPSLGTGLAAAGLAWGGVIVLKMRDEAWDRL